MSDDIILVNFDRLLDRVVQLLVAAGLRTEHAESAAKAMAVASLRGTDSHGLRLLPHYLAAIEGGRIDPRAEFVFERVGASVGILDAHHGIGHAAITKAMEHALDMAYSSGCGLVSVRNSNHCGALAPYAMQAADRGCIGIVATNTTPKMRAHNSTASYFGTNPFCVAAPMKGEEPFCYDASQTITSSNTIKMMHERGEAVPAGLIADREGRPTTDAGAAAMLLPLGGVAAGYKGFGLAMVVDIFTSLLSGMPNGDDVSTMYPADGLLRSRRYLGHFVAAVRVAAFESPDVFERRLRETAEEIRALPQAHDATEAVMVPGDPEKHATRIRREEGVPISRSLHEFMFGG